MTNEEALMSVLTYCEESCGKLDTCKGESETCCEAPVIRALKSIDRITAERDAAVQDLGRIRDCSTCLHRMMFYVDCPHCHPIIRDKWEWRGVKK